MSDAEYTLADLCDLADVTPRTVRYYIAQGILRSPGTSGPGARYDDGHLARLRLVRRLQREHLPLAEIRARLAALTDEETIAQASGAADAPAGSALDYVRSVLGDRGLRSAPGTPPGAARASPPLAVPAPPLSPPASSPLPAPTSPTSLLRRVEAARSSSDGLAPGPPGAAPLSPPAPAGPPAEAVAGVPLAAGAEAPVAERSQWDRFVLAPDVELHVRRPLTRSKNRAVSRLLELARRLLEEDQP